MGQLASQQQGSQAQQDEPNASVSEQPQGPQVAWWCKLLAKIIGAFAGAIAIVTGIWTFASLSALCILGGIIQILAGFLVLIFEVPMCCMFLDITKPIAGFAEKRSFFQKAILYGIIAIIPVAMCFGVSTLIGCALVFATGVLYGLMALGKKANRDEMRAKATKPSDATSPPHRPDDSQANLMENQTNENPFNQQQKWP